MAHDVNVEQFFNEKQLFAASDVRGEDDDFRSATGAGLAAFAGAVAAAVGTSAAAGSEGKDEKKLTKRELRKKLRSKQVAYWLESKYDILAEVCSSFENWKEAPSMNYDFDLLWCDTAIPAERFMKLKTYQKMNHFGGMSSITRKNNLGRNLLRMRRQFPSEFKFFPDTWILPTDLSDFKTQFQGKAKTFIIKPDNGCQGKGIFLIRDVEKVPVDFQATYVAQRYINKPFLLDGLKFDLRLYVLVVGCDPLRIFLHRRGLVRMATEQYEEPTKKNLDNMTTHLTNYAVNKMSSAFKENTNPEDAQDGHKRSWEAVQERMRTVGHDVDTLNHDIDDLIVKTLIAVQPSLSHFYHSCQPEDMENGMCFEILGFDVLLDHKLQPILLEVNHAPSFAAESELDRIVKYEVLQDSLRLLHLTPEARRQKKREAREKMEQRTMGTAVKMSLEERAVLEQEIAIKRTNWEDQHLNGYKRLYPSEAQEKAYFHIHEAAINIWEMLMGGNSRRSVRITQEERAPEEESAQARGKRKDAEGDKAGEKVELKRTAEEMREVVERLAAGCSARPRPGGARRRAGRRGTGDEALEGAAGGAMCSDDEVEHTGADGEGKDAEVASGSNAPLVRRAGQGRPEVQVGDVIRVQTNLGWESVTVKAKRNNGKIDIQFKCGEYMRSVLPRILRDPTSGLPASDEAKQATDATSAGATSAAASSSQCSAGSGQSRLQVRSRSSSHKDSRVAPLPPPCSPSEPKTDIGAQAAASVSAARGRSDFVAGSRVQRGQSPSLGFMAAQQAAQVQLAQAEPNRVHEARLRQQLQQSISVRPIVTHRKSSNDSDVGRGATRRHTYGNR